MVKRRELQLSIWFSEEKEKKYGTIYADAKRMLITPENNPQACHN
jgi:hypothetical protein